MYTVGFYSKFPPKADNSKIIIVTSCVAFGCTDIFRSAGPDVNFCGDLPSRASEIQLSLAPLKPSPAIENLYVL